MEIVQTSKSIEKKIDEVMQVKNVKTQVIENIILHGNNYKMLFVF